MIQEILYTSAPQGLRPGSHGFCTVVSTRGMSKSLADCLESLTGYRAAFSPNDPRAATNPVNFSHFLIRVGGASYHLLSRICDAGLDYTNRTNKLAHQIAVDPRERVTGGPAWVMAADGFFVERWDGNVCHREISRSLRTDDCPGGVCRQWAALTGDAGWAGTLAEIALAEDPQPIAVIFKPGTHTLSLVIEAMSLLPPELRWKVTFSTYFTKPLPGIDCLWRFVLDGTPEANLLRRNPHARMIDLCSKALGSAQGGALVEAARTGKRPLAKTPSALPTGQPPARQKTAKGTPPTELPTYHLANSDQDIASDGLAWLENETSRVPPRRPQMPRYSDPFQKRRRSGMRTILLGGALAMVLVAALASAFLAGRNSLSPGSKKLASNAEQAKAHPVDKQQDKQQPLPPASPPKSSPPTSPSPAQTPPRTEQTKPVNPLPPTPPPVQTTTKAPPKTSPDATKTISPQQSKTAGPLAPTPPPPAVASKNAAPPKTPSDPFRDIREKGCILGVKVSNALGASSSSDLAKVYVDSPTQCTLKLLGSEEVRGAGRSYDFTKPDDSDGERRWTVQSKTNKGLADVTKIADFTLNEQALQFKWRPNMAGKYADLQYCVLEMAAGGEKVHCSLHTPTPQAFTKIELKEDQFSGILTPPLTLPEVAWKKKDFRFQIDLDGKPQNSEIHGPTWVKPEKASTTPDESPVGPDKKKSLDFYDKNNPESRLFQMDLWFSEGTEPGKYNLNYKIRGEVKDRDFPLEKNEWKGTGKESLPTDTEINRKKLTEINRKKLTEINRKKLKERRKLYKDLLDDPQREAWRKDAHDKVAEAKIKKTDLESRKKRLYKQRLNRTLNEEEQKYYEEAPGKIAEADRTITQYKPYLGEREFLEHNLAWCERVLSLLDELEKSQIGCRVALEIGGHEVVIIQPKKSVKGEGKQ